MKVWNYVFIAISMMLFFTFVGYKTALSGIFDFFSISIENGIFKDFNFNLSTFTAILFKGISGIFSSLTTTEGLFASLVAGGITAGLYYAGKPEIAIKAGFVGLVFVGFISSLYFPLTMALEEGISSWAIGVLAMIFVPFTIGFGFAIVEYVIGGNTD